MNHLLAARHDGVDRRILPCPQTFETKLACVIGERCGNVDSRAPASTGDSRAPASTGDSRAPVSTGDSRAPVSTGDGEEHRRNLTDHGPSLPQMADGARLRGLQGRVRRTVGKGFVEAGL